MVGSFNFARIPHLLFGPGKLDNLSSVIGNYGRNVLLVTGSTSFAHSLFAAKLFESLNDNNIEYFQTRILKEPSPSDIDEVVSLFRWNNIDVVAAIGGGSVMDAGKAISAMLPSGEPVKDSRLLQFRQQPEQEVKPLKTQLSRKWVRKDSNVRSDMIILFRIMPLLIRYFRQDVRLILLQPAEWMHSHNCLNRTSRQKQVRCQMPWQWKAWMQ